MKKYNWKPVKKEINGNLFKQSSSILSYITDFMDWHAVSSCLLWVLDDQITHPIRWEVHWAVKRQLKEEKIDENI